MTNDETYDFTELFDELRVDEGVREFPYTDTAGKCSIGIGRNLSNVGLRADEITFLFRNDVDAACAFMDRDIPWWRELPSAAQRVMINLCFNMGWGTFSRFTRFLTDMRAHNYVNACYELQTSLWWREVGIRGPRIVARLRAIVSIPA